MYAYIYTCMIYIYIYIDTYIYVYIMSSSTVNSVENVSMSDCQKVAQWPFAFCKLCSLEKDWKVRGGRWTWGACRLQGKQNECSVLPRISKKTFGFLRTPCRQTWLDLRLLCHTADTSAVRHSRHVGCVTQQTCLLGDTADMFCCASKQTCLLCDAEDMSAAVSNAPYVFRPPKLSGTAPI